MKPEDYNKRQMQRGALGWGDITRLVAFWQAGHGLEEDGKAGPDTIASLAPSPFGGRRAEMPGQLACEIVRVAVGELGQGEEVWNNSGEAICRYAGLEWNPDEPLHTEGEWCALFAGWVVEKAHRNLGLPVPTWRYEVRGGIRKPVAGAKRLVRLAGEHGSFVARHGRLLGVPIPGDLFSLDRGAVGSWQGHVGVIERYEDGVIHTIEGNVGAFPARVRRFMHDLKRTRLEDVARLG